MKSQAIARFPSMGSVGDRYANAMIEAFWPRMQVELLDSRCSKTPFADHVNAFVNGEPHAGLVSSARHATRPF